MHISEGILSAPVLIGGGCLAFAGTAIGLAKTKTDDIPKVAILASAFFVASLIHIPFGGTSVHLILNGLLGILLGWAAVPAILIALFLQAVLFQFGGLSSLGANTVVMALPAVLCYYIFRNLIRKDNKFTYPASFLCGATAIAMSAVLLGLALALSGREFTEIAALAVIAHIPVMIIEGIITGICISFLKKVKPEMLGRRN
jgi:cobalt/nickel transport system permease protein